MGHMHRCAGRRSAPQSDAGSLPAHERQWIGGTALSPDRLFELEDLEVNPANNRESHVADGYPARSAPFECSEMCMAVNDEIRHSPVEDDAQLAVTEHPILGEGLAPEGGGCRREVDGGDADVSVQGKKGSFQRLTFAAGANGKPFQGSRVDSVWPLVRPESATAAGRPGDPYARTVGQTNHGGATVEHFDATAFEHAPERCPAQRSQVMIAEHRHDGQASGRQDSPAASASNRRPFSVRSPATSKRSALSARPERPGTALSSSRPRRWRSPIAAIRTRIRCVAPRWATGAGSCHSMDAKRTRSVEKPECCTVYLAG